MKKVFSVKKFKECCERLGRLKSQIKKSCEIWANECDGLTKEEMFKLGYLCSDDWMIEVEERKIVNPFTLEQFENAIERIKAEFHTGNLNLVGLFEIETLEYYYEKVKERIEYYYEKVKEL